MSGLSRRDLLKASAGAAAIAVPISALTNSPVGAAASASAAAASGGERADAAVLAAAGSEPVMFCVHDAARGEVSILQGASEVIVRDRQLVARVMRAAERRSL